MRNYNKPSKRIAMDRPYAHQRKGPIDKISDIFYKVAFGIEHLQAQQAPAKKTDRNLSNTPTLL